MTIRNIIITVLITICLTHISCDSKRQLNPSKPYWADTTHLSKEELTQRQVWIDFKQVVLSKKLDTFKRLSLPCLYCPDCDTDNSNSLQDTTDTNNFISTNKFITDYFQKVFSKRKNEFYFNEYNLESITAILNSEIYLGSCCGLKNETPHKILEVIIGDNKCSGDECSQTIFTFVYDDSEYKFYSIVDIP